MTATYFLEYEKRTSGGNYILTIYGDGKELWNGSVSAGIEPIDIDIDVTGVLKLTIERSGYIPTLSSDYTTLGDVALWT